MSANNRLNSHFYQIATHDADLNVLGITADLANVHLLGGSPGQIPVTNGAGNLSWLTVTGAGTVNQIDTATVDPNALGFTLSGGPITAAGTVTLTVPDAATLRTQLGVANTANVANYPALNGNANTYLVGNGTWANIPVTGGTVTSVSGAGSGLGFSLGGTVTSSGSITLVTPTATALRTSLGIGNIASTNYNSNGQQVLAGNGSWVTANTGTVTRVGTTSVDPSSLGFTLTGGNITTAGNIILNIPTNTALRASMNIGNVANINLNGNGNMYLSGNGTWQPTFISKAHFMAHGGNMPPNTYPAGTTLVFNTVDIVSNITYSATTGVITITTPGIYRLCATMQTIASISNPANDISFIWAHANGTPVYTGTDTFADVYNAGSTIIGTQATNEIIVSASAGSQYKLVLASSLTTGPLSSSSFVRMIAVQL